MLTNRLNTFHPSKDHVVFAGFECNCKTEVIVYPSIVLISAWNQQKQKQVQYRLQQKYFSADQCITQTQ